MLFLASEIMEQENGAEEINSNLRSSRKVNPLITLDSKWTLSLVVLNDFYITIKHLEDGGSRVP